MPRDIIVMGASLGGVDALSEVLAGVPADIPAALFVVLHRASVEPSHLPAVLSRAGPLQALHPKLREHIRRGVVYVAPPDRHLLIDEDRVETIRGPKENLHRPAIDPLFRSAAFYFRRRVIGVLLTGSDSDGTSGLFSVKLMGGLTVVQSPSEAKAPMMPFSAVTNVEIDYVLPLKEIGPLLGRLARREGRGVRGTGP